jgi:hypothetical protein
LTGGTEAQALPEQHACQPDPSVNASTNGPASERAAATANAVADAVGGELNEPVEGTRWCVLLAERWLLDR